MGAAALAEFDSSPAMGITAVWGARCSSPYSILYWQFIKSKVYSAYDTTPKQ